MTAKRIFFIFLCSKLLHENGHLSFNSLLISSSIIFCFGFRVSGSLFFRGSDLGHYLLSTLTVLRDQVSCKEFKLIIFGFPNRS